MIRVKKRDGQIVNYDGSKIINVIVKSMKEGESGVDLNIANNIEQSIFETLTKQNQDVSVEQLSDLIETKLMESGRYNTAKRFILYRSKRAEERKKPSHFKYKLLTEDFLSKYRKLDEPFPNTLGSFVFYRTYSRYLNELGRREKWVETVARAVDYNCTLAPTTKEEAEKLFDNMFYLRQTLSGRAMWASPVGNRLPSGLSFFNCSATKITCFEDMLDGFLLLLLGAGVGFDVNKEDMKKFPKIRQDIDLISQNYEPLPKNKRQEYTTTEHLNKNSIIVKIGDSREGWIDGLRLLFQIYTDIKYRTVNTVIFNYDSIRPYGELIKGFGGKASGAKPYIEMIEGINKILNKGQQFPRTIKPIDAMDIMNLIGMCVVSGNVRRSSEICLFEKDDHEILDAKSQLYKVVNGEWKVDQEILHRQMSNNTILYREKPNREELHIHVQKMKNSGEPAFANLPAMKKRHKDANMLNPCGEILILDNKGLCNLTSLNMLSFVNIETGEYDKEKMLEAQKLSARAGYRVTCLDLELPEWDYNQKKHRSLGCSLSGIQDFINATNISNDELAKLFEDLRDVAVDEANKYAKELGLNPPELVTTIKPAGSSSQLFGESSGVHFSHSPYFIRRVRVSVNDPLLKVAESLGYNISNEVGQSEELGNLKTKVVDFYCKSPEGKTKKDVSAIEQLEFYKLIMKHYITHNCSITVHVRDSEWDLVEQWLWDNWEEVIAISFIGYDDSFYQLLPYEEITKDEFEKHESLTKNKFTADLISEYEKVFFEVSDDELEADCSSGACSIR